MKFFLENCLLSVIKASASLNVQIIVCDNHSTDGSCEYFQNRFPQVQFIWQNINEGFAKANNRALKDAYGEFILFLNPDTIIAENTLEKCLNYMLSNKNCGALGVKMIDGNGNFLPESKRGFPNAKASFGKLSGLNKLNICKGYYATYLSNNETGEVDVLAGAFFLTRKKILDDIGPFDESFFMFGEDVDLSYRIQKAGYKNIYFPETTIIHFKGESTQRKSQSYIKNFYGAMHLFVDKHQQKNKALVHCAINAGSMIAGIKNKFVSEANHKFVSNKTAIVCEQSEFSEVVLLLKHAPSPLVITGRIAIQDSDKEHAIGNIQQIELLIQNKRVEQIVFCEKNISNKKIIELVQQFAGKTDFLFYENGSKSIIGSNNKNSNGIFISVQESALKNS